MGGGTIKHRFIDVWAWRDPSEDYVEVSQRKPALVVYSSGRRVWHDADSTSVCSRVFTLLTRIKTSKAKSMAPVRIRVPAWTVLKGDDDE